MNYEEKNAGSYLDRENEVLKNAPPRAHGPSPPEVHSGIRAALDANPPLAGHCKKGLRTPSFAPVPKVR